MPGPIADRRPPSPEAESAVTAFHRYRTTLVEALALCGSGRQHLSRGHAHGARIAGALDVSSSMPRFDGVA
jgi:hypothetical protein